jgi:hypothetical protein
MLALTGCVDATASQQAGQAYYQEGAPVLSWNEAGGNSGGVPVAPLAGAAGMDPPTGPGGTGGAGGAPDDGIEGGGAGGVGGAPAVGPILNGVTLSFTTGNQGGRYAPDNVGAVWIADASGAWVKTLERWAWIRGAYLSKYNAANPSNNMVDAVASATLMSHGAHDLTWDLTDANGAKVAPGLYTAFIEVTEREDTPGEWTQVDFAVGSAPNMTSFPDSPYFMGVLLTYQ